METTKNKAASPGRGETAQSTTDSINHLTPITVLCNIDFLDIAAYVFILATGAVIGGFLL